MDRVAPFFTHSVDLNLNIVSHVL